MNCATVLEPKNNLNISMQSESENVPPRLRLARTPDCYFKSLRGLPTELPWQLHEQRKKVKSQVLLRFELGSLNSESKVLTITPLHQTKHILLLNS